MDFDQIIELLDHGLIEKTAEAAQQFGYVTKNCLLIHTKVEKSQFQEAERLFISFEKQFNPSNDIDKLRYYAVKCELLYRLYQYDLLEICLFEAHELALNLSDEMNNEVYFWYYLITRTQAYYYHIKGVFERAIDTYIAMKEIAEKIGMISSIGMTFGLIGEVCTEIGDFEKALESFNFALKKFNRVHNKIDSAYTHLYIGIIHEKRGDFLKAKNAYLLSLEFFGDSDAPEESYKTNIRLGHLQLLQGEVEMAITRFQELLPFVRSKGYLNQEAELNHFLGIAMMLKNQYTDSIEYLTMALQQKKKASNPIGLSLILFHLINAAIFANEEELRDLHLEDLKKLSERANSPIISIRKKLIEANLLKDAPRLIEKVKAQQMYEEIVNDTSVEEFEMKIIGLINLCDLLVFEIKNSNDSNLLVEAYDYIAQIHKQAKSMNSFSLSLEADLLKSKFLQCEFKFNDAISLLESSIEIASELGLSELKLKSKSQLEKIFTELEKWNDFSIKRKNIKDRIEEIELKEYLNDLNKILRSK